MFWEELRDYMLGHAPLPPVEPKLVKARPMTDEQAREFEKEVMPFGIHQGKRVAVIASMGCAVQYGDEVTSGLQYLSWLADQTFIDDLRRYLANETIARQR